MFHRRLGRVTDQRYIESYKAAFGTMRPQISPQFRLIEHTNEMSVVEEAAFDSGNESWPSNASSVSSKGGGYLHDLNSECEGADSDTCPTRLGGDAGGFEQASENISRDSSLEHDSEHEAIIEESDSDEYGAGDEATSADDGDVEMSEDDDDLDMS